MPQIESFKHMDTVVMLCAEIMWWLW